MEIVIVLFLIILNGLFAMAEMAIISLRKHKLQKAIKDNDPSALTALELAANPNRFLSTTQMGITLVGIFAGAFGGATIADALGSIIHQIPPLAPYSDVLALGSVIILITYLTLIFGELVPKRIALNNPEKIARLVARPMDLLSRITVPIISLLSLSTDGVLKLLHISQKGENQVSEEEVRMLIKEGTEGGVFEVAEKNIVERTFRLSDRQVNSLMTARKQIIWLDIDGSFKSLRDKVVNNTHAYYPVCKKTLDQVIGVVRTENVLKNFLVDEEISLEKTLHKPLFIPSNTAALKVLELFKKSGTHMALIVDEYGMVEGLISLTDILEAIVGDIPQASDDHEQEIIKRDKKSWLIDGLLAIDEFKEHFQIRKIPGEKSGSFHTIGGFVMSKLGRIPKTGDLFVLDNFTIEVVDMDGNRVDKVLLTQKTN